MALFRHEEHGPLAVLRPDEPQKAIEAAQEILREIESGAITQERGRDRLAAIIADIPHTYAGLLSDDQRVLDEKGNDLGPVQPGDSFVPQQQLSEATMRMRPIGDA